LSGPAHFHFEQALSEAAGVADAKTVLRRKALLAARASAAAYGEGAAARVAQAFLAAIVLPAGVAVGAYAPLKSEIDPTLLLQRLVAAGHPVGLPVIAGPAAPLSFRRWRPGQKLVSGQFGARQPGPGAALIDPDVLIVPLVAFDSAGYRLGRGGGFYDRTIAEMKARKPVLTIGFAFAAQHILQVPREGHDQRLDWIVTEEGALHCPEPA